MEVETVVEKHVPKRTPAEVTLYKQRLNRAEGQVRGLKQMIDDHRQCSDVIQQSSAVIAAVREVALMYISQNLRSQATRIEEQHREADRGGQAHTMADFIEMLRLSYRFV